MSAPLTSDHQRVLAVFTGYEGKLAPTDEALAAALDLPVECIAAINADLVRAKRLAVEPRGKHRRVEVFPERHDDIDEISRRIAAQQVTPSPPADPAPPRPVTPTRTQPEESEPRLPPPSAKATPTLSTSRAAPIGSRPSIEWVLVGDLNVDDTYQREIDTGPSRALIRAIADAWDWRMCMPLVVSRRDAGLFVIDGQHRLHGALDRGDIDQLPCMLARYGSPAEEAEMFVRMNRSRRAMNRLDDFHAAQVSGDEDTLAVAKLITDAGFTVARRTGSATWVPGEVAFTSSIRSILRRHGADVCAKALTMMAEAFPGERLVAGSSVFTALCRIMVTPPAGFDHDQLFRGLLSFDMRGWADFLANAKGGDDRAQRLRTALLMAYDDAGKAVAA